MKLTDPLPAPPQYIALLPIERNKGFAARNASSEPPTWKSSNYCSLKYAKTLQLCCNNNMHNFGELTDHTSNTLRPKYEITILDFHIKLSISILKILSLIEDGKIIFFTIYAMFFWLSDAILPSTDLLIIDKSTT